MIKCNVTACGIISNSAVEKQSKDGKSFISFSITIPLPAAMVPARSSKSSFPLPAIRKLPSGIPPGVG